MSKRISRIKNLKLKKFVLIAALAISLIVIYTFKFVTKSDPAIPVITVKFAEKGTSNIYEAELEIHRDELGAAYVILPEKVQNAYASKFYKAVTNDEASPFSEGDDLLNSNGMPNTELVKPSDAIVESTKPEENIVNNSNTNTIVESGKTENENTNETLTQNIFSNETSNNETNTINENTINENIINNTISNTVTNTTNTVTENTIVTNSVDTNTVSDEESQSENNIVENVVQQARLDDGVSSRANDTRSEEENTISENIVNENRVSEATNTVSNEVNNVISNTTNTVSDSNTNTVTNTLTNTNTTIESNIINENTTQTNEISNTINNTTSNTIVEGSNHIVEDLRNTVTSSPIINENKFATTITGSAGQVEGYTYVPNTKYYLTEMEETNDEVEFEIEFQTITISETVLYNQELISAVDDNEITAKGYMPMGCTLNLTTISTETAKGYIADVSEFIHSNVVVANDISINKADGGEYQPLTYNQTIEVTIKSQNNIQDIINKNSIKLIHVKEEAAIINLERIPLLEIGKDHVKFVTNEFSPYILVAEPPILPDSVTIDDYESDYNYYMGLNYTQAISGINQNTYTKDNMAKVTINYYGYDPEYRVSQMTVATSSWSSTTTTAQNNYQDSDGTRKTIYRSTITATIDTTGKGIIDPDESWQLVFSLPSGSTLVQKYVLDNNIGKISNLVVNTSNNTVTVANSTLANWTENSATSYTISLNVAFTTNVRVTSPATKQVTVTKKHLIGKVSSTERQTLFTYIKALPIDSAGNISLELIDNPYMDRPKGAGFDGWATHDTRPTISCNSYTYVQTLTMNTNGSKELTIDLYANWAEANIIFISNSGNNNNTGYTIDSSKSTIESAAGILDDRYKYATNASDRELNIVVLTRGTYDFTAVNNNNNNDANSVLQLNSKKLAYTLTSLYNGIDHRNLASLEANNNMTINNDFQIDFVDLYHSDSYINNAGTGNINYYICGNTYNFRIGRGVSPYTNKGDDPVDATLSQVQGGPNGITNINREYRMVVESGRYRNVQLGRASYSSSYTSSGTLVMGCDFDRISNINTNLQVFNRTSSRTAAATIGPVNSSTPNYRMIIKSGTLGRSLFDGKNGDFAYAGIYVGGHGSTSQDNGDRVLIVEGGDIANIIGGLATASGTKVLTRIQVKGGTVQNIVGGAGVTQTYGDRIIQVTGGTVAYSVSCGSNGYRAANDTDNGKLDGNTLAYIGGNAEIGTVETTETLYYVEAGCVLGAGNGNDDFPDTSGQVFSSHIIIDGDAKINNNVYGGGNFGKVAPSRNITYANVQSNFDENETYIISNNNNVTGTGMYGMTNVRQGTNNFQRANFRTTNLPADNIQWYFEPATNGTYYIKNLASGKYLQITGTGTNGTLNTVDENQRQAFTIVSSGSAAVKIYVKVGNRTFYLRHNSNQFSANTTTSNTVYIKSVYVPNADGDRVKIEVLNGTIMNNIYAGSNTNSVDGDVFVKMIHGTVNGSIYGGSNTTGTITGTSNIDISGGTIGNSEDAVYAGGQGSGTIVSGDTTVKITDASDDVNIYGSIYGGSALGSVSGESSVSIEDKISEDNEIFISGDIFGGGKGNSGTPANNNKNCIVTIDGGTYPYARVFGGCNVNGVIKGAVTVKIGENLSTYVNEVYGGGNEAGITADTDNVYVYLYQNATVENAFNGGNSAGIVGNATLNNGTFTGTVPRAIYAQGATVRQALFGGSNSSGELQNTFVFCSNNAKVANVFGGGKGVDTEITGDTLVNIQNSEITNNAYGGGDQGVVWGNTIVTIDNTQILSTAYGGGNGADTSPNGVNPGLVDGNTNVTITNSNIKNAVYGGGKGATASTNGNPSITITNSNIYNEKKEELADGTVQTVALGNVYGGGDLGQVNGSSTIVIKNSKVGEAVYGGGNNANLTGETSVSLLQKSETQLVYGGGNNGAIGDLTYVDIYDSTITDNVYGGGNKGEVSGSTKVTVAKSKVTNSIFGGGQAANVNSTTVNVSEETQTKYIYGGGDQGEVIENTSVNVINSTIENNIYGGGNGAVEITGAVIPGRVGGSTDVNINQTTAYRIFGGGRGATALVEDDTDLILNTVNVTDDIYGGGDNGRVDGSTSVGVTNSNIGGSAYAAGNGITAIVAGNSYIYAEGNTRITKSLFGGGNAAPTGETEASNVVAVVDVAGAVVGENVYGGANSSVIYGDTIVNIGNKAINDYYGITNDRFTIGKIDISGTVYGGGEQMDPTKEFNFDTISVTGTITINVDGQGYDVGENTIYLHGSIFGSGNASSANTNGNIYIKNYGKPGAPKRGISLQRSTITEIVNSSILLNGTTDSTSLHPDGYFTLNRISDIRIINNSTMYLRNGANLVAAFSSLYRDLNGNTVPATVDIVDRVVDSNGNTHDVINGKIFDGTDLEYYVESGVIYNAENDAEVASVESVENAVSISKNTDNRIYMYSGINLNLANDENLKEAFSNVTGMTYFGLYKSLSVDGLENDLYMGIYDPSYPVGSEGKGENGWIDWNDRSYNRSYVLGLHRTVPTEQDIAKDGFYTTYEKFGVKLEDDETVTEENYDSYQVSSYISYITPTPERALHYMWYAGPDQETYYYTFNMIASKHSSFGTHELNLLDLSFPNATLTVLGDELEPSLVSGVGLYDKSEIPNINPDEYEANNKYGITMKSGTSGWNMVGETDFYYNPENGKSSLKGNTVYTIENSTTTPTLFFIFYHSNNLTESRELGYYKINMEIEYWKDSLNKATADVIIDIALSSEVYTDLGYNGAIAPGPQYDIFTSTPTNITTESSFSTYFELAQSDFYEIENIRNYYQDSYRVIATQYVFPVNTTITMIDRYDRNNPQYYYYVVTQDDVDDERTQYKFTDFLAMGSTDKNYNEIEMRDKYYISENGLDYEYENFIFIVDFANADFVGVDENTFEVVKDQLFRIYLNVLIDGDEQTLFGLLDDQIDTIKYGIYNSESAIEIDAKLSKPKLYLGNEVYLNIDTQYNVTNLNSISIYDTRYFDKKLGVKLTIYKKVQNTIGADDDGDGQIDEADEDEMYSVVPGENLLGTYFELNKIKYYPRADGTTRIKVAELVSNASSQIKIGTENSTIATSEYKILVESFGSADGIYFGIESSASDIVYMEIINDAYGLDVRLPQEQVIIDKDTGFTLDTTEDRIGYVSDGNNTLDFTVDYMSGLNNPYITVSLYRRNYNPNNPYDRSYSKVDIQDYVQETLVEPMEIDKSDYNESDYEFIDSIKQFDKEYTAFDTNKINAKVGDDKEEPVTFSDLSYTLKENLTTGTYKVVFTVYDTNATIVENIVVDEATGNNIALQYNRTEYEAIGDSFAYIIIK